MSKSSVLKKLAEAHWPAKLLASTVAGTASGGAAGYLASPEGDERDVTSGALAGALAGPAAFLTRKGLRGALDAARWLGTKETAAGPTQRRALKQVLQGLNLDEMSTQDVKNELARLRGYGLQPTLADVGGESTRGMAEMAATVPGPARNVAVEALGTRLKGQKPFVEKAVLDNLTPTTDVAGQVASLEKLKRADANQQYGDVYAKFPNLNSPELSDLLPRLGKAGAFDKANELADIRGVAKPRIEIKETPQGNQYAWSQLSLEEYDLIKRGLDAKIKKAERDDPTIAGALKGLKAEYLAELDKLTGGEYAAARGRFRELSTTQEAIQAGRDFDTGTSDDVLADFTKLSPADQTAFRVGVGRRLLDLTEKGKEGVGLIRTILDTKGDRLRQLFPDQATWDNFKARLEASLNERELDYQVLKGPATGRRVLGAEEKAAQSMIPFLSTVRSGGSMQTGVLNAALDLLGHDPREINRVTDEQLTRLLLNPDEAANVQTLRQLDKLLSRERLKEVIKSGITTAAVTGTAALAGYGVGTPPEQDNTPMEELLPGYAEGGPVLDHRFPLPATPEDERLSRYIDKRVAAREAQPDDLQADFDWARYLDDVTAYSHPVGPGGADFALNQPGYDWEDSLADPVARDLLKSFRIYVQNPLDFFMGIRERGKDESLADYEQEQGLNAALTVGGGAAFTGAKKVGKGALSFILRHPEAAALLAGAGTLGGATARPERPRRVEDLISGQ